MEPNFVLMKLPGETSDRVRRDPAVHAGEPQQPDRLDRRPQRRRALRRRRSSTTSRRPSSSTARCRSKRASIRTRSSPDSCRSWNQQGSHVRRGALIVIPIGRALLYAEPIYLQAERSPMPELRLVVLALQDRLAYGPTFEAALAALFGGAASSSESPRQPPRQRPQATASAAKPQPAADFNALIAEAAKDLADYQRLTAEGKLGEAGQKLQELKDVLDKLNTRKK